MVRRRIWRRDSGWYGGRYGGGIVDDTVEDAAEDSVDDTVENMVGNGGRGGRGWDWMSLVYGRHINRKNLDLREGVNVGGIRP